MRLRFSKMHGIGNDFVMVDAIRQDLSGLDLQELARTTNDRRFGIGGDGLILTLPGDDAPFRMRMFNPDGSESEMCGNGVRCFAAFVRTEGLTDSHSIAVETGAGLLNLDSLPDGRVRVDMGLARLTRGEIGMTGAPDESWIEQPIEIDGHALTATAVSMGNPHLVIFVDDVASVPLADWGPRLERHPEFPNRVNVHFVQAMSREHLVQRTWERGASATLACGTGACASAVAGHLTGRSDARVRISLPGGDLEIEIAPDRRVHMTGPAQHVFSGEIEV